LTHESFKDIVSFYDALEMMEICKFLDGKTVPTQVLLVKWFDQWKTGNFRPIFDEIKTLNETWQNDRVNDTSTTIPPESNDPRNSANNNEQDMITAKTRKGKYNA